MTDKTKLAEALEEYDRFVAENDLPDDKAQLGGVIIAAARAHLAALTPCVGEGGYATISIAGEVKTAVPYRWIELLGTALRGINTDDKQYKELAREAVNELVEDFNEVGISQEQEQFDKIQAMVERLEGEKKRIENTAAYEVKDIRANGEVIGHNAALDRAIAIVKEVGGV